MLSDLIGRIDSLESELKYHGNRNSMDEVIDELRSILKYADRLQTEVNSKIEQLEDTINEIKR